MSDIFNGRSDGSSSTGTTTMTTTESLLVQSILRVPGGSPADFTVHLLQPYTNVTSISLVDTTFDFSSVSTVVASDNYINWKNGVYHVPPGNYPTLDALLNGFMSVVPDVVLAYDPLCRRVSYRSDVFGSLNIGGVRFSNLFGFGSYFSNGVSPSLQYAMGAPLAAMGSVAVEMSVSSGNSLGAFNFPNPTPVGSSVVVVSPQIDRQTFSVPKMTLNDFRIVLSDVVLDEWEMTLEVTCSP